MDNEIPVLNEIRFRSLDGDTVGGSNQTAESKSTSSSLVRSNANNITNNIYPYGNVPLALLQQQIPADIKVGGGGGNSGPSSSKRPSFYQWPLVGNFFGNHGRSRFKSGSGRKYEPQGQLTPPSLQQLQQGNGVQSSKESISRRPFTRRNNPQQTMSVEDQTKVEYYLLRQQQLHLQQQQLHQANRLLWGNSNRSQQLSIRGQQLALANQQQYQQQWVPQRQVVPPPPPPPQWRPDALVDAEITRYSTNNKPIAQGELSMPMDHMQQTFAQTLLNPANQQFIERFRNQQQQNIPQLRSSMILPSTEMTTTPTLTSTGSLIVANVIVPSSSITISSSPVTLTTMTISNTLASHSQQSIRQPEVEHVLPPIDNPADIDMEQSESIQVTHTKKSNNEDSVLSLATIEAATLLSAKAPTSISHRQMNETVVIASNNISTPAASADTTITTSPASTTLDFGEELSSTNQTVNPSNVSSSITTKEDVVIKDNSNSGILWSDYPSEVGTSPVLMSDELYPDPEQLGQARDEYWSNKALTSRVKHISPSSVVAAVVGSTFYPHAYAAMRPSRLQLQEHQPLYIPLNPADRDRQSRQLQAQYYADTTGSSTNNIKKSAHEPVQTVVSAR